ncbi:MAG: thioesterase [Flavobacteriaceae bacterium]|nr:thioesterase [Flavobacteriaceae bacterium]RCL66165.1 MAG: DUF4442 domain-containing protein [Cryomorphaceae bacterium]|tara:strand:+ start:903 stop:1355 length:453 start_codon:yes stop_codon:yes gene_type:complete
MKSPFQYNLYNFFKLPSVWWCGIRVKSVNEETCLVGVKHMWINQNPFKSMFWAVQGMAAELSTGLLLMNEIARSKRSFSMLVLNNKANFSKKATGRISFSCNQGLQIRETIKKAISSGEPQKIWLNSCGVDSQKDTVSTFSFEWTLKVRK